MKAEEGNDLIRELISDGKPFAAGKLGAGECRGLSNFFHHVLNQIFPVVWNQHPHGELFYGAGVFPLDPVALNRFCEIYIEYLKEIDIVGIWQNPLEEFIIGQTQPNAVQCQARALEPFYHPSPWTESLEGKTILVVSPFEESIKGQINRNRHFYSPEATMKSIWPASNIFWRSKIKTLKIPFCAAIERSPYSSWEEGLLKIQNEIAEKEFDLAIIGAGAWSVPLAVHCKRLGRIGIHTGGATQLFFGIKGKRWDNHEVISKFYNDHWTRPTPQDTPVDNRAVEEGCYW